MSLLLLVGGAGSSSLPPGTPDGLVVEIGFDSTPNTPQSAIAWTDVTADVLVKNGVGTHRGRSTEVDTIQAGTCSFSLKNNARKYDPTYSSGTYYGRLKVRRPVRISYISSLLRYDLFTGFVRSWPQSYPDPNWSEVPVSADDGFRILNLAGLTDHFFVLDSSTQGVLDVNRLGGGATTYPVELPGDRVNRYLDLTGWPSADRTIASGRTFISETPPTGGALAALQGVADAEFGIVYITTDGKVQFEDRQYRITNSRSATSQITFGDSVGEVPYQRISIDPASDKVLVNDARRTGASGREISAQDSTSITTYGRATDAKSVPAAYDTNLLGTCQWIVKSRKEPQFRVESISVDSTNQTIANLLRLQMSDRVTVNRRPQGVGSPISQDFYIEGINVTIGPLLTRCVFDFFLSPVDNDSYFTLDTSTLNGPTVLGY